MSPETEDQRNSRIRDAQIRDRMHSSSRKPTQNAPAKKRDVSYQANKSSQSTSTDKSLQAVLAELLYVPPGAVRDIVIGFAYGLIPAFLAVILLPDSFKILALLIPVIGGAVGFLLGTAT